VLTTREQALRLVFLLAGQARKKGRQPGAFAA
jgi:hypothetical protein